MQTSPPTYVIGDVHGQLKKLVRLLRNARIIDDHQSWKAGEAALWFIGDLVDRGPDSIGVLDLVMRLQAEAAAAKGQVACLLGNHELMMLAAYHFGRRSTGLGSSFISKWKQNGGSRKDLAHLTSRHLEWLARLPAMAVVDQWLLLHADAPLYLRYGQSVVEVNRAIGDVLRKSDALVWEELIEAFVRRGIFAGGESGEEIARRFLAAYGGQRLVHGHTPIHLFARGTSTTITAPLIYAGGQCVNVDGGMHLDGPGFIYQLPQE